MRPLLSLLLVLQALPAAAQEEPESESESEVAPSLHPGSDSPEAVRAPKFDGPRQRAQAFLIPMDEGARTPTIRVAQAVENVLVHTPTYEVVDLGRALSVESTAEQAQRAAEGRKLLAEGNTAAASKGWPEAAAKYQRALQEFDKGLPAVGPREYADLVLRLGTATFMSGEDKPARELFALAVRLDPEKKLAPDEAVAALVEAARAEVAGVRRASLEVEVRPAGARIFVDGDPRGTRAELPTGKHLLRVERSGFYPYAEVVEVSVRKPAKVSVTLAATPTAASLNQIIAGASDEVGRGAAGKNIASLAQKFSLERLLIGSVRSQEESRVSVTLSLVDAPQHRVIAARSLLLASDGTDADQIEAETSAAMRKLIAQDSQDAAPAPAAAPVAAAAPAPAPEAARKPVIPAAAPTADDPGLVAKERKVAVPASTAPAAKEPAAATKETAAPASKQETKKKKQKSKGLEGKTGTEDWGDEE